MFWHNIQITIRTTPWVYWVTVVIAPAVVGGVAAYLVMRVLIRLYDRHPRELVRCRRCYYDLRATAGDTCPECGADLTRGVWTEGGHHRRRLAIILLLWTVAIIAAAVPLSHIFRQNTYYAPGTKRTPNFGSSSAVHQPSLKNPVVININAIVIEQAVVNLSVSRDWVWVARFTPVTDSQMIWPWSTPVQPVDHWKMKVARGATPGTIPLYAFAVEFKPHSRIPLNPRITHSGTGPLTEAQLVCKLNTFFGKPRKTFKNDAHDLLLALDAVNRINYVGPGTPPKVIHQLEKSMKGLTAFPGVGGPIVPTLGQSYNAPHYRDHSRWHTPFFRPAPAWTLIVPASFFTLLWLLGLPLLYLRWRKRELSPWQPRSTDIPTAPTVT